MSINEVPQAKWQEARSFQANKRACTRQGKFMSINDTFSSQLQKSRAESGTDKSGKDK